MQISMVAGSQKQTTAPLGESFAAAIPMPMGQMNARDRRAIDFVPENLASMARLRLTTPFANALGSQDQPKAPLCESSVAPFPMSMNQMNARNRRAIDFVPEN